MPCLGQCLHLGRGSKNKDSRPCGATGTYRRSRLAHCMQPVESSCAHAKPVGEVACAPLDPSSPQAVTDQVARTSSDGFLNLCGYRPDCNRLAATVAELRRAELSLKDFLSGLLPLG